MNTRYDPRADKITVAITEAIIVSQRDHEHPSFAYVETDTTLKALAVVAARIAFETKIADSAAKGATFAEKHAEMVGQTLEALRKGATSILSPACSMTSLYEGNGRANLGAPSDLG